jgi:hypothetical protein
MEYHDSFFHAATSVNDDDDDVVRACHNNFYRTNQDVHDESQDAQHVRGVSHQAYETHCHVPVGQCNRTSIKLLPIAPNNRRGQHVPLESATTRCKFSPTSPPPTHADTLRPLCDIAMSLDFPSSESFRRSAVLANCEFAGV